MTTTIEVAGEALHLLPQRALWWPARRLLMVADAHFGKAARFRTLGVPVPPGTTASNLQVLDALVLRHAVERIVFLGDLMHGRLLHGSATFHALIDWRERRPALSLELVPGNHDRHAGDLPPALEIRVHRDPFDIGPFALRHHPEPSAGRYVLAGHVHPVVALHGSGRDRVRTPCFVFGEGVGVLPAFGAFTGGFAVARSAADRVYVVAGERVLELPAVGRPG
ncbi:MAG: ligase-associated DNA damage response endonuclease PdeM [bacterium]|jgi:DNA ligase-associated metallophosphoesterase|nr:ligase-associated DNA damage response endonuclease PdeM [Betaproteobacteria bacterium]